MAQDVDLDRVLRLTGATYRQLDHWCRRGYLRPGNQGEGQGHPRDWPYSEIQVAETMVRLVQAGIKLETAAQVARAGGNLEIGPGVTVAVSTPRAPRSSGVVNGIRPHLPRTVEEDRVARELAESRPLPSREEIEKLLKGDNE